MKRKASSSPVLASTTSTSAPLPHSQPNPSNPLSSDDELYQLLSNVISSTNSSTHSHLLAAQRELHNTCNHSSLNKTQSQKSSSLDHIHLNISQHILSALQDHNSTYMNLLEALNKRLQTSSFRTQGRTRTKEFSNDFRSIITAANDVNGKVKTLNALIEQETRSSSVEAAQTMETIATDDVRCKKRTKTHHEPDAFPEFYVRNDSVSEDHPGDDETRIEVQYEDVSAEIEARLARKRAKVEEKKCRDRVGEKRKRWSNVSTVSAEAYLKDENEGDGQDKGGKEISSVIVDGVRKRLRIGKSKSTAVKIQENGTGETGWKGFSKHKRRFSIGEAKDGCSQENEPPLVLAVNKRQRVC